MAQICHNLVSVFNLWLRDNNLLQNLPLCEYFLMRKLDVTQIRIFSLSHLCLVLHINSRKWLHYALAPTLLVFDRRQLWVFQSSQILLESAWISHEFLPLIELLVADLVGVIEWVEFSSVGFKVAVHLHLIDSVHWSFLHSSVFEPELGVALGADP